MEKLITKNKKAYFDYDIIDSWEAWVELKGHEVKSIREKHVNLRWSYISSLNWFFVIKNMQVTPWKALVNKTFIKWNSDRKVFLHKKTLDYLSSKIKEAWFSCVPLELYFKWSLIKLRIWLVKWRKNFEKKQVLKERTMDKEAKMAMKKYI
jgi:SsrA-binding protein